MEWKSGEKGPTCFCGMPTNVVVDEKTGECNLLCIFHTALAGAIFPLPKSSRPDHWPEMTDEQMSTLIDAGYAEQDEREPGVLQEITLPDELDIKLPEGQGNN